ncbi:MAG: hypothetical protein JOY67_05420 [Hyphomicrobiales bacterium]|nr:hypothetical protein [Hyphomicrobiales bacterium]MBV9112245.1 hypothetical protein [Hyphomicrobiales bacterium]MBV9517109.1 hypothetical protein [Hyphomicrobiales bacterium]
MTSESEDARFLPGRHQIEAYGNGGFRFGGMSHRGSILALPSGVRAWPVRGVAEIDEAALVPIIAEAEAIEILLLGTGKEPAYVEENLRTLLAAARIRLDAMQTGAAARTYNVLIAEDRRVAAALIAVG